MRPIGPCSSLEEYHVSFLSLVLDLTLRDEMYSQRAVDAYLVHRYLLDLVPTILPRVPPNDDKFSLRYADDKRTGRGLSKRPASSRPRADPSPTSGRHWSELGPRSAPVFLTSTPTLTASINFGWCKSLVSRNLEMARGSEGGSGSPIAHVRSGIYSFLLRTESFVGFTWNIFSL
jgi:hypothetical protein